jgi:hypothetical protein
MNHNIRSNMAHAKLVLATGKRSRSFCQNVPLGTLPVRELRRAVAEMID